MKKLQTRLAYSIIAVWCLTFIISLFPSCEIGLGAAVDTQPPSLTIETPKVDAVIRDVFALTGRWSDDGTIDGVRAELKRTDGKGEIIKINGTFNKDEELKETGTWKIPVDYQQSNIGDGTYQATVFIKDKSRHETSQSTTFTVDNTAPVLVLSRPSTKNGAKGFDSYGQTFTLEGKAADDNEVSLIEVNIFETEDSTEPLKTIELKNVPLTIEQDVAKFVADAANDYAKIYGHVDENGVIIPEQIGESEQRYCTIKIYDGAQRYPEDGSAQTEEDKKGNNTDVYYMNSEITSLLQGEYKITDLYHIMSGTYENEADRAAGTDDVKTKLEPYKVTKSKFSINPANNPKYVVTSMNVLENGKNLDLVDYQFTAGNRNIEVEVSPGLDGWALDPDSIGIYLLKCNTLGQVQSEDKIWLVLPGAEHHFESEEAKNLTLDSGDGIYSQSGDTYKFRTSKLIHKLNYGVVTDNYYIVMVEGHDVQGEASGKIIADGKYAFKLISNEEKIELLAKGVPDYISKERAAWNVEGHTQFKVELSWTTGEGPFNVYRQIDSDIVLIDTITEPEEAIWKAYETFDYDKLTENGTKFPGTISYYLTSVSDTETHLSTTATIVLKYDSTTQSISNIQFANAYEKEEEITENGQPKIKYTYYVRNTVENPSLCTISGIATDDTGIETVKLVVPGLAQAIDPVETGRFKFENINFASITAPNITATIIVTDVAGNQMTCPLDIVFDTTAPTGVHLIDSKEKDLLFRIGEADNDDITSSTAASYGLTWDSYVNAKGQTITGIDTKVGKKYSNNTYGNDQTIQIRGDFSDGENGSGVKLIYYRVSKNEVGANPSQATLNSLISEIKAHPTGTVAPLSENEVKRVFYNVKGSKQNKDSIISQEQASGGIYFSDPKWKITNPNDPGYNTQEGNYKFYKYVETSFNTTISGFTEGANFLILVVEDNVGNVGVETVSVPQNGEINIYCNYSLNVDTVVPHITSAHEDDILFTNGKGTVQISGIVDDEHAGLSSLEFYLGNTLLQGAENITVNIQDIGTGEDEGEARYNTWEATIPGEKFPSSGTSTIYALATDQAGKGNSTKIGVATVKIDTDGPKVTVSSPAQGKAVNKSVILSGSVSDSNGAGVKGTVAPKLYWTTKATAAQNNPDPDNLEAKAKDGWVELVVAADKKTWDSDTFEWTFTIDTESLEPDGENSVVANGTTVYFSISASDKAGTGNTGYSTAHPLVVDQNSDRPTVKFTNVNILETMTSSSPIWITKQEIYGTVQDDDGQVQSVEISFDADTATPTWTNCYNVQDGLHYSFPLDGSLDGTQVVYFRVIDAIGTEFVSSIVTNGEPDTNAPILAYQNTSFGNTTGKYSSVLYANIDFQDPTIPCIYYSTEDFSNINTTSELEDLLNGNLPKDATKWKDLSTLATALGGDTSEIYIIVKALDANGIDSLSAKIEADDITLVCSNEDPDTHKFNTALYKLDISNIAEVTTKRLNFTATDNANHTHLSTFDISIDNKAPVIDIDRPSPNSEIYGTEGVPANNVTISGRASDSSETTNIYMTYTKSSSESPDANSEWIDITRRSALTWTVIFNVKNMNDDYVQDDENAYHTSLFNNIVDQLYGAGTTTSVYKKDICLWFYAQDELGNNGKEDPTPFPLTILTQGDKPTVSISYPGENETVGGVITVSGGTSIATSSVREIWLQIDPDYNEALGFAANWETSLQALLDAKIAEGFSPGYQISDIYNSANTEVIGRGIKADGSKQNWNKLINVASEFVKIENGLKVNRTIAVRAYAVSETDKISEPEMVYFTLDPESPTFGNNEPFTLVQWSDNTNGSGIVKASKLYEPGMWIQGKWWLTGSVEDESGIDFIKLDGNSLDSAYYEAVTGSFNGLRLNIPVGKAISTETVYGPDFTLLTKESGDGIKTSSLTVTFCYDNTPPEFESTTLSTDSANATRIEQSDGVYEIRGNFNDGQNGSGFSRIAFYVTRSLNSINYVTDIMAKQGESGIQNCITQNSLSLEDGLYLKQFTGCTALNNTEVIVPAGQTLPSFARKGGICRINDIFYRIENIEDGQNNEKIITLDSKIANGTVNVDFILAQVIDNPYTETGLTTWFGDSSHEIIMDDGDEMVESFKESSGIWNVSINSKNIKDGAIQLHFVAFDLAGNKTTKTYYGIVANNAPRIAGIKFGTDVNGNGEVDIDELRYEFSGMYNKDSDNKRPNVSVNGETATGSKVSKLALPNDGTDITSIDDSKNSIMTVKGVIKVIPEIVGGNNNLSWTYSVNGTTKSDEVTCLSAPHGDTDDVRADSQTTIELSMLELLKKIGSDGNTVLGFKIWDHTEGTTPGTDSNSAEVLIKVNIALRDTTPPTAGIKPFYWNSNSENSLVYDSVEKKFLGHIELEKDLSENFTYKSGAPEALTTGLYDLDPKVSGIVYLEGYAQDNVAIEKLYVKVPGLDGFDNFGLVAQRDSNGQIVTVPNLADDGIEFTAATETIKREGDNEYNYVTWKIKLDTAKIESVAATDVLVQVKAKDRGQATLNGTQTSYTYPPESAKSSSVPETFDIEKHQTGYKIGENGSVITSGNPLRPEYDADNMTSSYRIDIVPYITSIESSLSKLRKNNPSVFARTAQGHYAVSSAEKLAIHGFNISEGDLKFTKTEITTVTSSYDESDGKYAIPETAISGKVSITVSGVESLNNINNNEAYGAAYELAPTVDSTGSIYKDKQFYNRQPNGDNNNLLTDDIVVDIWQINSEAAKPSSGPLTQPVMAINPKNKQVGFAFANGSLRFSMGSLDKSYDFWEYGLDFWTSIGFAYDANGNSFGTAAGGDINATKADAFGLFTSRWTGKGWTTSTNGHNNGTGQLRLELIGQSESNFTNDTANINKERIKSPSIATTVSGADATDTTVYLAYYDEINNEIRFKWGILSDSDNIVRKGRIYYAGQDSYYNSIGDTTSSWQTGLFADYYGPKDSDGSDNATKDTTTKTVSLTQTKVVKDLPYTLEYVSLIAGQTTNKRTFVPGASGTKYTANTAVMTRDNKPVNAGQYVSIAAKYHGGETYNIGTEEDPVMFTDDLVVAVWYDAANNQMLYSYNTAPQKIKAPTYKGNNYNTIDSYSQSATGWSTPVAVFGEANGIGEYCKVALDVNGKVHIACYDNANADVWYAYIDSYASPSNAKTCIVDSYGIVGTELNLDVALKDGKPVPYISYYGSSCARPKVAYWASQASIASTTELNGAVDEAATGNWEVSVIPSSSKISIDHINVGVWKDAYGNLTNSKKTDGTVGTSSAGTSNGMIYGNGSMNPILGYAITKSASGYIETAQMK